MKHHYLIIIILFYSCNKPSNLLPEQLRNGTFKTIIEKGNYESFATRNDSIQIETYNNKTDTFYINWKSNFEYTLLKKNPKNKLEKKEFIVKITGIKSNSYTFSAHTRGSNFKQNGKAILVRK